MTYQVPAISLDILEFILRHYSPNTFLNTIGGWPEGEIQFDLVAHTIVELNKSPQELKYILEKIVTGTKS